MVTKKNIVQAVVIVCLLVFMFGRQELAAEISDDWQVYTSAIEIRKVDYFSDTLQVVTSGGWLKIDPDTRQAVKLTGTDGLGTSDLFDIYRDAGGTVWLAGYGRLVKYRHGQFTQFLFVDNDDKLLNLYSLADDGDNIWIGTSAGLALFSKINDGGQIEDFYFRFGSLNAEPTVYDVIVAGDTIWLGTSAGLAIADKSDPGLLKSYINWVTYNAADKPAFERDTVYSLAYHADHLFIGTARNTYRVDIDGIDTSFFKLPTLDPDQVRSLDVVDDTLLIYCRYFFYKYVAGTTLWGPWVEDPPQNYASGRFIEGTHWLGTKSRGLYFNTYSGFARFPDGGLPGNTVEGIAINDNGVIAAVFDRYGSAVFSDGVWTRDNIADLVPGNVRAGARSAAVDSSGTVWIGTWGNGLLEIGNDTILNYDETNSSLRGNSDDPVFVVVNDLAVTPEYLFAGNFRAVDGNAVSVFDLSDPSQSLSFGAADGITSDLTTAVGYHDGHLAVGTENSGVFYYYCGDDPFNKSDDSVAHLREDNSRLVSNAVNVVEFDRNGELWVGTKFGLSHYDRGIDRFVTVVLPDGFGPLVTCLAFDRRGNMWLGSINGLAFYNASVGSFTVYNIINSGLPSNDIKSVTIDPTTNDLWVGTPLGIGRFRSRIGRPAAEIGDVIAFPNPFIIRDGSERLQFNYAGLATVRIYTVNGELVREFDVNLSWDGTNESGRDVAAGVYLALITSEEGDVGRAKIMLIRNR